MLGFSEEQIKDDCYKINYLSVPSTGNFDDELDFEKIIAEYERKIKT